MGTSSGQCYSKKVTFISNMFCLGQAFKAVMTVLCGNVKPNLNRLCFMKPCVIFIGLVSLCIARHYIPNIHAHKKVKREHKNSKRIASGRGIEEFLHEHRS